MNNVNESLLELSKLIQLMDEDADNLSAQQAISDYIVPILGSFIAEIDTNRQAIIQTAERTNLAMLMSERTFLGEILVGIGEHFSTIVSELGELEADSNLGIAVTEIQDLIATWTEFESADLEEDDADDADDESDFSESELTGETLDSENALDIQDSESGESDA